MEIQISKPSNIILITGRVYNLQNVSPALWLTS